MRVMLLMMYVDDERGGGSSLLAFRSSAHNNKHYIHRERRTTRGEWVGWWLVVGVWRCRELFFGVVQFFQTVYVAAAHPVRLGGVALVVGMDNSSVLTTTSTIT